MTWVLIAIAGWLVVGILVGLLTWGLARSAAIADRDQQQTTLEAISRSALARDAGEAGHQAAEGRVQEVPARVYTVEGDHATYLVTLADGGADRTCTCPATGDCSHMAAALGEQSHSGPLALEALESARAFDADKRALDRREGSKDRRAAARPWAENSSGRRAEDALRQDLADAEQALTDAEARLAEIEGRQSA